MTLVGAHYRNKRWWVHTIGISEGNDASGHTIGYERSE